MVEAQAVVVVVELVAGQVLRALGRDRVPAVEAVALGEDRDVQRHVDGALEAVVADVRGVELRGEAAVVVQALGQRVVARVQRRILERRDRVLGIEVLAAHDDVHVALARGLRVLDALELGACAVPLTNGPGFVALSR